MTRAIGRATMIAPAPSPTAARGTVLLALLDGTASLGAAFTAASAGRYRWTTEVCAGVDVVVIEPRPVTEITALAGTVRVPIMVVDLADRCAPADIAACLEAGADAFVRARNPTLVLAHLEALARAWTRRR